MVDSEGQKVRPNHTRSTVILRDVPDNTQASELEVRTKINAIIGFGSTETNKGFCN